MPVDAVRPKSGAPGGAVQVAVAVPLRRLFDYRSHRALPVGARVKVPFGRRMRIGVAVSNAPPSATVRLKSVAEILDRENIFGPKLLQLIIWAANYYHHPLGEALQAALPAQLRGGGALAAPTDPNMIRCARLITAAGTAAEAARVNLARAPLQQRVYHMLQAAEWTPTAAITKRLPGGAAALRQLQRKGLVEIAARAIPPAANGGAAVELAVRLNRPQHMAVAAITEMPDVFRSFLLHGVTGSGKTEVYLAAAENYAARGRQVLILVPEIALTPQLVARVRARLGERVCVVHSALTARQRYRAWHRARAGEAAAVLGTRSAIFTPFKSLGLILVDEEHDISYKQQDGFRYHARDLAIKRAQLHNVPVVLGSATPAMETRQNARRGRHHMLQLRQRAAAAQLPRIAFVDLKKHPAPDGISAPLARAIGLRLARGEQSIVFLNRRGFAPAAVCKCGWRAMCIRCNAHLTYHRTTECFRCHHCGYAQTAAMQCGDCGAPIFFLGLGTQKLERALRERFPAARISRLDRDHIGGQKKLEAALAAIANRETDIIIGTQLIAKGHDFSQVTLVGVVNSDQGLYSLDFRAPEYLFQQLAQVAGRAGRGAKPGEVLIQTMHPEHRVLQTLRNDDFAGFAEHCLRERRAAAYPPFQHLALWRAESVRANAALRFLQNAAATGEEICARLGLQQVQIFDAVAAPMEKLAGRYRAQLLVRAGRRKPLQQLLQAWCLKMETERGRPSARWSVDVDPMEMF